MDCAATAFCHEKSGLYSYHIDGQDLNPLGMIDYHEKLSAAYPELCSIEDPFHEEDFESFSSLTARIGGRVQTVSDDLTVTQLDRLTRAHALKSASALLVKPNQAGDISGAAECVEYCKNNGWDTMISHRSGAAVEDTTISHLAVGWNVGQIKAGAPCGERNAKYNELLRIERQLRERGSSSYAGQRVPACLRKKQILKSAR